ncbi:MAG: DUF1501 domain-containing protein [Gammaproteobacteria bacterium]|nr:DUF1501 domain-containing protein [Gammaproteobacteria bacterium]
MARINRRQFLKSSSAATMFAATPGLAYSQVVGGGGPFDDYRALVCLFMFGGNDSFNMLVPRSGAAYNAYLAARSGLPENGGLALPQASLLPISPLLGADEMDFGLHPDMGALQSLFETGKASFVANVGPLVEETTREQFVNGGVALPPQLFSHNDQQDQWQSLKGNATSRTGWAGRMADLIRTSVADQQMATNASLFGTNLFQSADETIAYVMGPNGPVEFFGFSSDPNAGFEYQQRQAFERILGADYASVYERAFAQVQQRAIDSVDTVLGALRADTTRTFDGVFPSGQLGAQLRTVAQLIAANGDLQMKRQIFFVATGGFDTHDNQVDDQPNLLGNISSSMAAFQSALESIGMDQQVTTFTQSDFGRTLSSNGDGSDHAWGGHQIVMGGNVNGQRIYGDYPVPEIGGPLDVGGGRFIPSTSADQYAATLAKWFGIPDADLDIVAPNLANFAERDLGFMIA